MRLDDESNPIPVGHLRLRDSYFFPAAMAEGIDSILKGMAVQTQKEVDTYFTDGKWKWGNIISPTQVFQIWEIICLVLQEMEEWILLQLILKEPVIW